MSSDVWYHELLAKHVVMSKSSEYHPHYNIDTKEFENSVENNNVITKQKCIIEFNKPLITSYKCLVFSEKGFAMKELCEKIGYEWKKIYITYSEWIDKTIENTNVINCLYIYDEDENITRIIVNFNIPMNESRLFTSQDITKLQFVVPKSSEAIFGLAAAQTDKPIIVEEKLIPHEDVKPEYKKRPSEKLDEPKKQQKKIKTVMTEPTAEPIVEPIVQPTVEPITKPTLQPIIKPNVQPTVQPNIPTTKQKTKSKQPSVVASSKPSPTTSSSKSRLSISDLISKYQ